MRCRAQRDVSSHVVSRVFFQRPLSRFRKMPKFLFFFPDIGNHYLCAYYCLYRRTDVAIMHADSKIRIKIVENFEKKNSHFWPFFELFLLNFLTLKLTVVTVNRAPSRSETREDFWDIVQSTLTKLTAVSHS